MNLKKAVKRNTLFGTRAEPDWALIKLIDKKIAARLRKSKPRFQESDVHAFSQKAERFFSDKLDQIASLRVMIDDLDQSSWGAVDGHHGLNQFLDVMLALSSEKDCFIDATRTLLGVPAPIKVSPIEWLFPSTVNFGCTYSFEDFSEHWEAFFVVFLRCACHLEKGTKWELISKISKAHHLMMVELCKTSFLEIATPGSAYSYSEEVQKEIEECQSRLEQEVLWAHRLLENSQNVSDKIALALYDDYISTARAGRVKRFEHQLDEAEPELIEVIDELITPLTEELVASKDDLSRFLLRRWEYE